MMYNWDDLDLIHRWNDSQYFDIIDNGIHYGYNPLMDYIFIINILCVFIPILIFFLIIFDKNEQKR